MDNNMYIEDVFKGVLTGIFATYLIILGMRPAAIYPDNILDIIDNPWIFLILFILNYYILYWDFTIGLLFFLTLIALILDIIIFTDGDFIKDNMDIVNTSFFNSKNEEFKEKGNDKDVDTKTKNGSKSNKDYNDIILEQLKNYNKLRENSDTIKSHNSFL
jgi:hypothetical protein